MYCAFEITKWRLCYYCCYSFGNNFAWNAKDSNGAARAARGIYIMRRIMCALGRTFLLPMKKSERWFAMEAKEKELRRRRPRWSRSRIKKFRETVQRPRTERKGNSDAPRCTKFRSMTRNAVTPRWETRLYLYFPRWIAMDHLLRVYT